MKNFLLVAAPAMVLLAGPSMAQTAPNFVLNNTTLLQSIIPGNTGGMQLFNQQLSAGSSSLTQVEGLASGFGENSALSNATTTGSAVSTILPNFFGESNITNGGIGFAGGIPVASTSSEARGFSITVGAGNTGGAGFAAGTLTDSFGAVGAFEAAFAPGDVVNRAIEGLID